MPLPLAASQPHPPAGIEIEGHAIVSADGMIAGADGSMPAGLHNEADWREFQAALDRSALVVLGRIGHRQHPNPGRRRLVFTNSVNGIAADPDDPFATLFNPDRASFDAVLTHLGIGQGIIAVTGGTRVFDYFLPLYHRFLLAEANGFVLPEGRPCFPAGHPRQVLASAGLTPRRIELLDADANVTLTYWER